MGLRIYEPQIIPQNISPNTRYTPHSLYIPLDLDNIFAQGHRLKMPYADPERKRAADLKYAQENTESIRKRKAAWYQANKERVADKRRAHRRRVGQEAATDTLRRLNNE